MGGNAGSIVKSAVSLAAAAVSVALMPASAPAWATALAGGGAAMVVGYAASVVMPNKTAESPSYDFSVASQGTTRMVRQAITERRTILGRLRVSGVITWLASTGSKNKNLNFLITVATHPVDGFETWYVYDEAVDLDEDGWVTTGTYKNLIRIVPGDGTTAGDVDCLAAVAECDEAWTEAHEQQGCAKFFVQFRYNKKFSGTPDISVVVRGKKVYDPRDGSTAWSDNAVLCTLDYMMDEWGPVGADISEFLESNIVAGANVCDEVVATADGTEKRWTCNGEWSTDEDAQNTLENLLSSCVGAKVSVGGYHLIYPAAWREPTQTLDEDDLDGDVLGITTRLSRSEKGNLVKGLFRDPDSSYQTTDYPQVESSVFQGLDGCVLPLEFDQPFTTSAYQAQRAANIVLMRSRQEITVPLSCKLSALRVGVGLPVGLSLDKMGWSGKYFEVTNGVFAARQDGDGAIRQGVDLILRETCEEIYTSPTLVEWDPAPNTSLADWATVAAPLNLALASGTDELYVRGDGTVASRLHVSWDESDDGYVLEGGSHEVQYRASGAESWVDAAAVQGSAVETWIYDVADGEAYDVRVRARNGLGVESEWAEEDGHTVVGKTEPPSDVASATATAGDDKIILSWEHVPDADVKSYEIRDEDAAWGEGGELTVEAGSPALLPMRASGTHTFYVRALDTSGNYSEASASASIAIATPSVNGLSASYLTPNVRQGSVVQLEWSGVQDGFAIARYLVRRGAAWSSATPMGSVDATREQYAVDWGGTMTWWVAPVDGYGNVGTPVSIDAVVALPSASALTLQVIDNTVLLRWVGTAGSLPIAGYNIYRGAVDDDHLLGVADSTFKVLDETTAGTFQYFVEPVDAAGNTGTTASATTTVDEPPDFVLYSQFTGDFEAATLSNASIMVTGALLAPVDTAETWEEHFASASASTIQDLIDAGYSYWMEPSPGTASYQEDFDAGAVIAGCRVVVDMDYATLDESVAVTPQIYTKEAAEDEWAPQAAGQLEVYATDFRYVRLLVTFTAADDTSQVVVSGVGVALRVKRATDEGTVAITSQGQTVAFNKAYLDAEQPVVTPGGTAALIAVVDFEDVPEPTGFDVYLFDTDGNAATLPVTIGWTTRGVLQGG